MSNISLRIITLDNLTSLGDSRHSYGNVLSNANYGQPSDDLPSFDGHSSTVVVPASSFESAPDDRALLPLLGKVALGLLLSSFIVIAVAGNLLVIVAVLTDRGLRQTGNYFIVSLALADTLVAVAVMTFAVANDVMGKWVFGAQICRLWMSADVMCSTASILNLCAISADRYLHIRSPLHYDRLVTHRRCLAAIGLVWIMSALISFLPIHLGWHRNTQMSSSQKGLHVPGGQLVNQSSMQLFDITIESQPPIYPVGDDVIENDDETVCVLELNPLYAVLSSAISFYLPCLAMLCIYYRLHRYARQQVESIKLTCKYQPVSQSAVGSSGNRSSAGKPADEMQSASPRTTLMSSSRSSSKSTNPGGAVPSNQAKYKVSDHKAAITLGIIMGVFLLSWGPFFTINLVGALFGSDSVPPLVFAVFTWLGYCNSTMNPVIYSIFNRQFRDAFSRVLAQTRRRLVCCCRGDDSSELYIGCRINTPSQDSQRNVHGFKTGTGAAQNCHTPHARGRFQQGHSTNNCEPTADCVRMTLESKPLGTVLTVGDEQQITTSL